MNIGSIRPFEELQEAFSLFSDWEERYGYLIELGGRLPPFPPDMRVDQHLVKGCTSRVWLVSYIQNGSFHFLADSDAQIVRGLIYVLMSMVGGKTPAAVSAQDMAGAFASLGLEQNLSPNRRNGFFAMVERVKRGAAQG